MLFHKYDRNNIRAEFATIQALTRVNASRDHAHHDHPDICHHAFCDRSSSAYRGRGRLRACARRGPNAAHVPIRASSFSYHHVQSGRIEGACRGIRGVRSLLHAARVRHPLFARDHCSHSQYTSRYDAGDTSVPHKRRCLRTLPADNRRTFRVLPPYREGKI